MRFLCLGSVMQWPRHRASCPVSPTPSQRINVLIRSSSLESYCTLSDQPRNEETHPKTSSGDPFPFSPECPHYLGACLQEDGGSPPHQPSPSQAPQDLKERRAAKAMEVSLAPKGKLVRRETKETWAAQVRTVLGCQCLPGGLQGWASTLGNCVCSTPTEELGYALLTGIPGV